MSMPHIPFRLAGLALSVVLATTLVAGPALASMDVVVSLPVVGVVGVAVIILSLALAGAITSYFVTTRRLALQLRFWAISESMSNHDSEGMNDGCINGGDA